MSKFDRINTAITELLPTSAAKVFNFIDLLFENKLDKQIFKQNFWNFNAGEQYYLCFYLKTYFDASGRYTFFNKWLNEKELLYSQAGEEQLFHDFKDELYNNKKQLVAILVSYEITAQRRLKQLKNYKVPFDEFNGYFQQGQIDYRIPLYFQPNKYKKFFLNSMEGVMTPEQAEAFFLNSFEFGNNLYPIQLLYIELGSLTHIKEQIFLIKEEYDKCVKYNLEKHVQDHNSKINKLPSEKQVWYNKLKDEKPTNTDFAKIAYNAFPEIRDKSLKHKNGLDSYLKSYGSNLLIRE